MMLVHVRLPRRAHSAGHGAHRFIPGLHRQPIGSAQHLIHHADPAVLNRQSQQMRPEALGGVVRIVGGPRGQPPWSDLGHAPSHQPFSLKALDRILAIASQCAPVNRPLVTWFSRPDDSLLAQTGVRNKIGLIGPGDQRGNRAIAVGGHQISQLQPAPLQRSANGLWRWSTAQKPLRGALRRVRKEGGTQWGRKFHPFSLPTQKGLAY